MDLPLSVVLSLLVAFINTAGYYLQKKGQNEIESDLSFIKYYLAAVKKPKWVVGFVLAIGSMPVYIYALSVGHISITQPLANTGIIFLVILGIRWLKEEFGKIEIAGVVLLMAGIVVVSLSLPLPKENYVLNQGELIGFGIAMIVVILACIVSIIVKRKAIGFSVLSGTCMGIAATLVKVISILIKDLGYQSFSLLDVDFDLKLLTGLLGGPFQLASLVFYAAILFILVQIVSLTLAFKAGRLTLVIPLEMGTSFIIPVFSGFFLFHEPANVGLVIGISIALAGALALVRMQAKLETRMQLVTART